MTGRIGDQNTKDRASLSRRAAAFLDRDGVINRKRPEGDYVKSWEEFTFLPGVFKAIKGLHDKGLLVIVVTNQQGVAKGLVDEPTLVDIHEEMRRRIERRGGRIDAVYFCPHRAEEGCGCRKPADGLIRKAIEDFREKGILIDTERSYMIGDSDSDIAAGLKAGLRGIRIGRSGEAGKQDGATGEDLLDALKIIEETVITDMNVNILTDHDNGARKELS